MPPGTGSISGADTGMSSNFALDLATIKGSGDESAESSG